VEVRHLTPGTTGYRERARGWALADKGHTAASAGVLRKEAVELESSTV